VVTVDPTASSITVRPDRGRQAPLWRTILLFVAVSVLLMAPLPLLVDVPYESSADLLATMEVVGGIIGLTAGLTFVLRFTALGDRIHLLFGLAFLGNGSIDVVHGAVVFLAERGIIAIAPDALERVIPATFVAGRVTMVLLLVAAPLVSGYVGRVRRRRAVAGVGAVGVIGMGAGLAIVLFAAPGPAIFTDRLLSRPVDLVVGLVFVVAAVMLLRYNRRTSDAMTWWVALSAAIGAIAQLTMSFSPGLHSAFFDLGHVYKISSYVVPFLGLSLYQVRVIRDRNHYAAALELAHRAKSDLVSVTSHELRTPIATIMAFTELAREDWDYLEAEERHNYLELVQRQTHRLNRLVNDMLQAGRIEAGRIVVRRVDVDLTQTVHRALRDVRGEGLDAVEVELDIPEGATARADPDHVEQILANLLSNAVLHGGPPVRVEVDLNEEVRIAVSDHGEGVPDEFRGQLFEPFAQSDRAPNGRKGVGLGLTISAGLAVAQGGELWFEPNQPRGARFVLRLPASG
jgi:signal transduction histidine kinase